MVFGIVTISKQKEWRKMYNKKPHIDINTNGQVICGYEQIFTKIGEFDAIAIECYPGVDLVDLENRLKGSFPDYKIVNVENYVIGEENIQNKIKLNITDDRVFGYMSNHTIDQFYDVEQLNKFAQENEGNKVVYCGFGALLLEKYVNLKVYINLARWEIQTRHRQGMSNWMSSNHNEEAIGKFKRGFFFEWRVADRLKKQKLFGCDYIIDGNVTTDPKMISVDTYIECLKQSVKKPFRLVPFFDPGVWGGQWMKNNLGLEENGSNYAWSFDGVVEENSVQYKIGNELLEMPAIDIVFFEPKALLGKKVYGRFGTEFPIRFDFLDTVEGQNLSLQVHPLTSYIQEQFGMNYTQDESYYILDKKEDEDCYVYIGVKDGVDKEELFAALEAAKTSNSFDDEKYINKVKVEKHDHILIPAGTVHCSGANTMILEISATPYIFTFKLWDWNRLGTNGLPRPIHLEHGKEVLQMDRNATYAEDYLVNHFTTISEDEEKTGLHEAEFIETRRFFTTKEIKHSCDGSVNMLNVVSGTGVVVGSVNNQFEDYIVNYAETFIIPEQVKEYTIRSVDGQEVGYIKAYVR